MTKLNESQLSQQLSTLQNGWKIVDGHHLNKTYKFDTYQKVLGFVQEVGLLSERLNHHPKMIVSFSQVEVEIYSFSLDGLAQTDFSWAAQCDQLIKDTD